MMRRYFVSLFAGALFGFGLALSGMTHPEYVLGFLDVAGNWDARLLFVMAGATGVTIVAFRFILARPRPVLDTVFHVPTRHAIDTPLLVGAAIFGIGWGISGYCPGPGIASLAAPNWETWTFLPAMLVGTLLQRTLARRRSKTTSD
jgi:hypothetical protein